MDLPSVLKAYKKSKTVFIDLNEITPNPLQPRRFFDKSDLQSLASSIKNCGLIQPIAVKRIDTPSRELKYEIIAGERRWRACKMAGIKEAPCIVFETDQSGSAIMALVENLQRSDLSFFEEALAMQTILKVTEMPQSELAHSLSISQSTLSNKLRLLRLSERERLIAVENSFSERHCRALVRIDSEQERLPILQSIVSKKLTAPEAEKLVEEHFNGKTERMIPHKKKNPTLKGKIGNMKLLYNTLDKAVLMLKTSGYNASWDKQESDGALVVTICVKK
ncbi:MAG: ParB/RepB/Spo0J family partition protein [Clostridia bacterium]|nr:ParB/RepB/Spo0J family partition protein [Clostridia bacterium]